MPQGKCEMNKYLTNVRTNTNSFEFPVKRSQLFYNKTYFKIFNNNNNNSSSKETNKSKNTNLTLKSHHFLDSIKGNVKPLYSYYFIFLSHYLCHQQ